MEELRAPHSEKPIAREAVPEPSKYSVAVLMGLGSGFHGKGVVQSRQGLTPMWGERHVYSGTVPHEEVQRRRKANRAARKSRRVNKLRAR